MGGQTFIEKIVQRSNTRPLVSVFSGDFVTISPHRVMTHDNTHAVISNFFFDFGEVFSVRRLGLDG